MAAAAPSLPATGPEAGQPARVALGGPVYVFLQVVGYATVVGAIAVTIDALRRPASHFGGASARRWMWAGPQVLLLALLAVSWAMSLLKLGPVSALDLIAGLVALYLFFCAILQIAYLLVVVFPRHREPIPEEVEKELPRD